MSAEQQARESAKPLAARPEAALKEQMLGTLIDASHPEYEQARQLYNAMIDKRPRFIARCRDVADVVQALRFGRRQGLRIAVRGGAHNGPGFASCDDGLVIDLSPMRGVRVDPQTQSARVEGGAVWRDVDHATHEFGLATPSGVISTTGVGGLTLTGGHGYLTRKYGLTLDNLVSADVVLADGRLVRASEHEQPELFWALRGGGGNFGIVTSFEFRLHPVKDVYAGPVLWRIEDAPELMRSYDRFIAGADRDLYAFFALLVVPPAPDFPTELHGRKVCSLMWASLASAERTQDAMRQFRAVAEPLFEHVGQMSYPKLQGAFDPLYPSGLQWYWRGHFVRELSSAAIAVNQQFAAQLPSVLSCTHLYPINGAVHDVSAEATAFAHRDARYSQVIVGVDPDPAKAGEITRWTKAYSDALKPHTVGGGYLNFWMDEGLAPIKAAFRDNFARLTEIKRRYDPDNVFRVNQNIPPSSG